MVTPQTLQAINDMQVNVQTGLPVIPNNGNPAGAYNMPQHLGGAMPAQAAPDPYAWLQPSPAMMTAAATSEWREAATAAVYNEHSAGTYATVCSYAYTAAYAAPAAASSGYPADEPSGPAADDATAATVCSGATY